MRAKVQEFQTIRYFLLPKSAFWLVQTFVAFLFQNSRTSVARGSSSVFSPMA